MSRKKIYAVVALGLLVAIGIVVYEYRIPLYASLTSRHLNRNGGDITITNARIWTGDPADPWKTAMTVRNGKIVAMDAEDPAGDVVDAGGRLLVPGLWDCHTHPHAAYVLISPEAPMLQKAKTVEEVLDRVRSYVEEHPEDKFPRLFGWMHKIFKDGENPTRQQLDAVVSDRPAYLVEFNGHAHWANTKALELADALEKDPPWLRGDGRIHRDPGTGLATGYLEETEYASTDGVLLNTVKKVEPIDFRSRALIQRLVLEEYSKVGVTSIWTKDGTLETTRVYEQVLREDALPVRVILDHMYTPYAKLEDLAAFAARAKEMEESDLPEGFLRANVVKLFIDLPIKGWIWMFEPYVDGSGSSGKPAYPLEDFRAQMLEADRLGLDINVSVYGDRALHECLNLFEETARTNPPRERRHTIEHAEFIRDEDLPRFRQLGITASMNPIVAYPEPELQEWLREMMGPERLEKRYHRYKDLMAAGALVVSGSDFPIAPPDPLVGIHILVNGTDAEGKPEGGLWPGKQIGVEESLRLYTVDAARAAGEEARLGLLKPGYCADFAILSDDILAPAFDRKRLLKVKVTLTVMNGHVVHEDSSDAEKVIDFGE